MSVSFYVSSFLSLLPINLLALLHKVKAAGETKSLTTKPVFCRAGILPVAKRIASYSRLSFLSRVATLALEFVAAH